MKEDDNEVRTDTSRMLMSDTLRGVVPDDIGPDDELQAMAQNYIMVVMGRIINRADENPVIGTLEGIMHQNTALELEVKVQLDEGLMFIRAASAAEEPLDITFSFIELHNGEQVTRFAPPGGFFLDGARLGPIDYRRRMCVALLNLRHSA